MHGQTVQPQQHQGKLLASQCRLAHSLWIHELVLDALGSMFHPSEMCQGTMDLQARSPLNCFSFPHNSSVSTWPMRSCTTISTKCCSCRSKQTVFKRAFPWKQLILLVTRLEFWIFFSRYPYNIIRYFTGYMLLDIPETKHFHSRGLIVGIFETWEFIIYHLSVLMEKHIIFFRKGIWGITNWLKGREISDRFVTKSTQWLQKISHGYVTKTLLLA